MTTGTSSPTSRALRVCSAIGAGLLIGGVITLAVGVAVWKPLSTAPELWTMTTWTLIGVGLVVTIIATATLAATARKK
jgi:fructose-specific phosphotransferase system IIC component